MRLLTRVSTQTATHIHFLTSTLTLHWLMTCACALPLTTLSPALFLIQGSLLLTQRLAIKPFLELPYLLHHPVTAEKCKVDNDCQSDETNR